MPSNPTTCRWLSLKDALTAFVLNEYGHQGQMHIKPLHWYTACRLVIEGGFHPDDITPRPPFTVQHRRGSLTLLYDPSVATGGERTVLGGLKTKNVDVVVNKDGIGPCIAVSHKGVLGAFRNLTNRMEEAVGDCTNIHITYPALVYGFLVVIRANRRSPEVQASRELVDSTPGEEALKTADLAMHEGGEPAQMIARFHQALRELTGRRGVRNDVSRYEAIALALVDPIEATRGDLLLEFPPQDSPLRFERFFSDLYRRYDERYVYGAPDLAATTRRLEWSPDSPIFAQAAGNTTPSLDYEPRIGEPS